MSMETTAAVYTFGNTEEYTLLKPMVSDSIYYASCAIFEEYKKKDLRYKPKLELHHGDITARICGIQFMRNRDMEKCVHG